MPSYHPEPIRSSKWNNNINVFAAPDPLAKWKQHPGAYAHGIHGVFPPTRDTQFAKIELPIGSVRCPFLLDLHTEVAGSVISGRSDTIWVMAWHHHHLSFCIVRNSLSEFVRKLFVPGNYIAIAIGIESLSVKQFSNWNHDKTLRTNCLLQVAQVHHLVPDAKSDEAPVACNSLRKSEFVLKVLRRGLGEALEQELAHARQMVSKDGTVARALPFLETAARRLGEEIDLQHELDMIRAGEQAYQGEDNIHAVHGVAAGSTWLLMTRAEGVSVAELAAQDRWLELFLRAHVCISSPFNGAKKRIELYILSGTIPLNNILAVESIQFRR